ncbi:hypothetical protein BJ970_006400 [Saccharopolyspora phatthalungensis]|uniref:Uncharacterized protein n=1 Tax=Saccharopolyspora phatthalungensis TaxID=664693 RepID=A0A840QFF9_9PSEU|nr:hypothetical protein [Saccharopolyspora phatthalungensis]
MSPGHGERKGHHTGLPAEGTVDYAKLAPSLARAYDTYVESGREGLADRVDKHDLAGFETAVRA